MGQRGRNGLVWVMRCSENWGSLRELSCALDAHAASAVDAGRPETKGALRIYAYGSS